MMQVSNHFNYPEDRVLKFGTYTKWQLNVMDAPPIPTSNVNTSTWPIEISELVSMKMDNRITRRRLMQ